MPKRTFTSTIMATLIILVAADARPQTQPTQQPTQLKIDYSIAAPGPALFNFASLLVTVNGKRHVLISKTRQECLEIVDKRDFDGDGTLDALVKHITACGGNCCSDSFFFVSVQPDGNVVMSDEFADSWNDPVIEKWKGRWSVVVVSNNAGMNTERPVEITRRFVLENGKAVRVEEHRRNDMKSIVEMRSEMFSYKHPDETHAIEYDLDGDGKKDTITGQFWERWGSILWTVNFADGKSFTSSIGCRRIGVLPTKTHGVNDLVCDQDTVFHWDGKEYKE